MTASVESAGENPRRRHAGTAVALLYQQGEIDLVELLLDVNGVTYSWQGRYDGRDQYRADLMRVRTRRFIRLLLKALSHW
jgi:hypothetical protein